MKTWIALFRAINLLGRNPLPMKTLPALLETCGCADARTYIQSGNVVFRSAAGSVSEIAPKIGKTVLKAHKFEPHVLVLSARELARAVAGCPFRAAADANPPSVHLFFLAGRPQKSALADMQSVKAKDESFALKGRVFYLHTPSGFGISKLAARAERLLAVDATARNWRTCTALLQLAKELG